MIRPTHNLNSIKVKSEKKKSACNGCRASNSKRCATQDTATPLSCFGKPENKRSGKFADLKSTVVSAMKRKTLRLSHFTTCFNKKKNGFKNLI